MRYPRIYLSKNRISGSFATVAGPPVFHLTKVLRLGGGGKFVAFDGQGYEYLLQIEKVRKHELHARVVASDGPFPAADVKLDLVLGMPKQKAFDFVLQKATELGVDTIYPVFTSRSVPRIASGQIQERQRRWQQILFDACAQSGRRFLARVEEACPLEEHLRCRSIAGRGYLLHPHQGGGLEFRAAEPPERVTLFVGPEGGFDDDEVGAILDAGCTQMTVGPRILRVETAATVALALLQHEHGDLGQVRQPAAWEGADVPD